MDFLEKVVAHKMREVGAAKRQVPLASLKRGIGKSKRSFADALRNAKNRPAIIAEIKRKCPSKGELHKAVSGADLAKIYSRHADAISVVTDMRFFGGCMRLLESASKNSSVPVLAKDFIIDEYQIYSMRKHGADAVLLIAALLGAKALRGFIAVAKKLGMGALVEVHTAQELGSALSAGAKIIGINNRSLKTLKVDITATKKLAEKIPKSKRKNLIVVSESGFSGRGEIERAAQHADAVLVGTALMKAECVEQKLKELAGRPLLKICGITSLLDARAAVAAGADMLGFNFYKGSKRCIAPERARAITKKLPKCVKSVGVFVNERKPEIMRIAKYCGLGMVQLHGDEKPGECKGFSVPVIKALRIGSLRDLRQIYKYKTRFILLDALQHNLKPKASSEFPNPRFGNFRNRGSEIHLNHNLNPRDSSVHLNRMFRLQGFKLQGAYGGTGKTLPSAVLKAAAKFGKTRRVFVAGGLTGGNVRNAAELARPYAVDACSGVERKPGIKDLGKLKEFAVRLYGD